MNPYSTVQEFEQAIADYAGSDYAVAVESCTAAIFLSLMYRNVKGQTIKIPKFTYPSVPASIIHAGGKVEFTDEPWKGIYWLDPVNIVDGALRFHRDMYQAGTLHCLSFHVKKHLPIGRGGMILTNDKAAVEWLRKARFDGRSEVPLKDEQSLILGWNMYMEPSQAVRGMQLLQVFKDQPDLDSEEQGYPDLSTFDVYK